jgi:hypothetical protein
VLFLSLLSFFWTKERRENEKKKRRRIKLIDRLMYRNDPLYPISSNDHIKTLGKSMFFVVVGQILPDDE